MLQPYAALSPARAMSLTALKFAATVSAFIAGSWRDVAQTRTALGHMTILRGNQSTRLYIMARVVKQAQGAVGAPVVTINTGGRVLTRSTRPAPAFPTTGHPDVRAYGSLAAPGSPLVLIPVTAIDFDAGTATVDNTGGYATITVYYLFGDGEIAVQASRPFGSSTGRIQLYNSAARSLHETNQADASSAPNLSHTDLPLPQDFVLSIAVRSNSEVVWDQYAGHEVVIPAADVAISVSDPQMLAELAERQLRGQ